MRASWRWPTTAASWPPTAARCSSSACRRWTTSARGASRTSSRPRRRTAAAQHLVLLPPGGDLPRQCSHRFFAVARRPAQDANGTQSGAAVPLARPQRPARPGRPAPRPAACAAASLGPPSRTPRWWRHLETAAASSRATRRCCCAARPAPARRSLRAPCTTASPHAGGRLRGSQLRQPPESLIESELFGYRAGAFTGAQRTGRRGKILQADGGTLFLDEIGDMPLELQARLLRVLDERQVTPLGTEEVHDGRLPAAQRQPPHLPTLVREGRFREDLYYRLAGIELELPPLRDRSDRGRADPQCAGGRRRCSERRSVPEAERAADGPSLARQCAPAAPRAAQRRSACRRCKPIGRSTCRRWCLTIGVGRSACRPHGRWRTRPAGRHARRRRALEPKLNPIQANERRCCCNCWNSTAGTSATSPRRSMSAATPSTASCTSCTSTFRIPDRLTLEPHP
jgi:hypothetical protein